MKLRKNKNKKLIKLASKFQPWDYIFNTRMERAMLIRVLEYYQNKESDYCSEQIRDIKLALKLLDIFDCEDLVSIIMEIGNILSMSIQEIPKDS